MKIQQQNTWKRFANFREDLDHIAGFQVKLNALVSIVSHMLAVLYHFIHLIIQPKFQGCLRVEERLQEASKSGYKYLS